MVTEPYAVARHPDESVRALAAFTIAVAERPWAITSADRTTLHGAGFDDAAILHALLQAALFGHLNRIADAVGVAADYPDRFGAPRPEPATPAYLAAATPLSGSGPISLDLRDGIAARLAGWLSYALDRDAPLERRRRALIHSTVATLLGDGSVPATSPVDELDHALDSLAAIVTLAPWRLDAPIYERVRALGLADDAQVFAAVATASTCATASRISVVLAGFARQVSA